MSNLYIDPATGKMQQGKSGSYTEAFDTYRPPTPSQKITPATQKKVVYNPDGTRQVADDPVADYYETKKPPTPEEWGTQQDTIKNDYSSRIQSAIDAIEASYIPIYARAKEDAEGRLGSTAAVNALAGQRGAPSGQATREKTNQYNQSVVEGITADKQVKIDNIRRHYEGEERKELNRQEDLKREDADKWVEYMAGEETRKKERSKAMLEDVLNMGASWEELDEVLQQEYADIYGYDVNSAQKSWDYKIGQKLVEAEKLAQEEEMKQAKETADLENKQATTFKLLSDLERQEMEDQYKREKDKTELDKQMAMKGYKYIRTPKERDELKNQGYDITEVGGRTYAQKPEPVKSGGGGNSLKPEEEMSVELSNVVGEDGFVSPDNWLKARNAWIAEGLNPTTFDTKMRGFKNPNNPYYITEKEKTSSSSNSGQTP